MSGTETHQKKNKPTLRRYSTIATSAGRIKSVVHDTEVVAAIKAGAKLPSQERDLRSLETDGLSVYEDDLRSRLGKAVFVGHINTDLDSVAGAIGAAALFGGTPALAEPLDQLNGEITFALKNCGMEPPPFLDELPNSSSVDICLVDHTEEKQMVPSLRSSPNRTDRIVGVIDHHALSKSFQTARPIFMDLRPWGSMSTIVGYLFLSYRKALPKPLAVLLLQAILSDTLNLRSITTTDADRSMVALLISYGGIGKASTRTLSTTSGLYEDTEIDLLAKEQFKAKTNWIVGLGAYEMVRGDQKDFAVGPWKFSISVLEVTDTSEIMKIAGDILLELRLLKKEKGFVSIEDDSVDSEDSDSSSAFRWERTMELDFAFLFVVNVVEENSILLICGGRELALAKVAFMENDEINPDGGAVRLQEASPGIHAPGSTINPEETAMVLPKGYVSRKAQFVPTFFKALQDDFEYEKKGPRSEIAEEDDTLSTDPREIEAKLNLSKASRKPKRRQSSLRQSFATNAMEMAILREMTSDEELVKVNEITAKQRSGNLYDERGRVVRTYVQY